MFRFSKTAVDELFVNLKVLGKLEPGDKLIVSGRIWILDKFKGFHTIFYRWWHRESRNTTNDAIQHLLELAFTTLNNAMVAYTINQNIDELYIIQTLLSELICASKGLSKLKVTYEGDAALVSKIDVYLGDIQKTTGEVELFLETNCTIKSKN
jgi:hypothetical protein